MAWQSFPIEEVGLLDLPTVCLLSSSLPPLGSNFKFDAVLFLSFFILIACLGVVSRIQLLYSLYETSPNYNTLFGNVCQRLFLPLTSISCCPSFESKVCIHRYWNHDNWSKNETLIDRWGNKKGGLRWQDCTNLKQHYQSLKISAHIFSLQVYWATSSPIMIMWRI